MKNTRGFTVVELVIVVSIVAIVAAIGIHALSGGFGSRGGEAREAAEKYASDLGLKVKGVSCANRDTDGDGYVSCSISVEDPGGRVSVQPAECATGWTMNSGCRVPKPVTRSIF